MSETSPDMSLVQIIAKAQTDNAEGMAELFEAAYRRLYYYSYIITGDRDTAQDLLHDGFIKCMLSLDTLHDPNKFYPWMWHILKNTYSNMVRKDKAALLREESVFFLDSIIEDADTPQLRAEKEDLRRIMQCIIHTLPEEQREAIVLRYYDDLSINEIAAIQSCPPSTVKSRLQYAKKSIKSAIIAEEARSGIKLHSAVQFPVLPVIMAQLASYTVLPESSALTIFASVAEFFGFTMVGDSLRLIGTVSDENSPILSKTAVVKIKIFPAAISVISALIVLAVFISFPHVQRTGKYNGINVFSAETIGRSVAESGIIEPPVTEMTSKEETIITTAETAKQDPVTEIHDYDYSQETINSVTEEIIPETTTTISDISETVHTISTKQLESSLAETTSQQSEITPVTIYQETTSEPETVAVPDITSRPESIIVTDTDAVQEFSVSFSNVNGLELESGQSFVIKYFCEPVYSPNQEFIIYSDNTKVAECRGKEIMALSPGTARIYLRSAENPELKTSIPVTVTENISGTSEPVKIEFLYDDTVKLYPGYVHSLNWDVTPAIFGSGNIVFDVGDEKVAFFDGANLYAYAPGTTVIYAYRISDNAEIGRISITVHTFPDDFAVPVSSETFSNHETVSDEYIEPYKVMFNPESRFLKVGETSKLTYSLLPFYYSENSWYWKLENDNVITFEGNTITAIGAGKCMISFHRASDDKKFGSILYTVTDE